MNITSIGRLVLFVAVFAFAGYMTTQVSAEEPKIDKKRVVKTAGPAGQPGGGIQSTKASGASKVAKDRVCSGATPKIKKVSPDEGSCKNASRLRASSIPTSFLSRLWRTTKRKKSYRVSVSRYVFIAFAS